MNAIPSLPRMLLAMIMCWCISRIGARSASASTNDVPQPGVLILDIQGVVEISTDGGSRWIRTQPGQTLPRLYRPPGQPEAPDYELFEPAIGEGAYGKVWLARNAIGQWRALKAVYLAKFRQNASPFEREFNGIRRYKPVSEKHPGLLRVEFVSRRKDEGYFYYVMELADAHTTGWEQNPVLYEPRDLTSYLARSEARRLPLKECLSIGVTLAEALEFLHQEGFTHRDVKPQNIIFVNGQPKLADVGLVAEIRPPDEEVTWVGTPEYMPPPPEPPGTTLADIYALGMVLYVMSTGRKPARFPELTAALMEEEKRAEFRPLNAIILKSCHPDCRERYASASAMRQALGLQLKTSRC